MTIEVRQIREEDIESFHTALDVVAREHAYLALLRAPPIERASAFVHRNIENGYPQLVAIAAGEVVGWCNIAPAMPLDICASNLVYLRPTHVLRRSIAKPDLSKKGSSARRF
jgi:hypothetical protein